MIDENLEQAFSIFMNKSNYNYFPLKNMDGNYVALNLMQKDEDIRKVSNFPEKVITILQKRAFLKLLSEHRKLIHAKVYRRLRSWEYEANGYYNGTKLGSNDPFYKEK